VEPSSPSYTARAAAADSAAAAPAAQRICAAAASSAAGDNCTTAATSEHAGVVRKRRVEAARSAAAAAAAAVVVQFTEEQRHEYKQALAALATALKAQGEGRRLIDLLRSYAHRNGHNTNNSSSSSSAGTGGAGAHCMSTADVRAALTGSALLSSADVDTICCHVAAAPLNAERGVDVALLGRQLRLAVHECSQESSTAAAATSNSNNANSSTSSSKGGRGKPRREQQQQQLQHPGGELQWLESFDLKLDQALRDMSRIRDLT
jgi:hypothetical protein